MNFAERISALRKEHGLSQEGFAEQLGVSRQSVSKWESGASMPELDKISLISELFGVSTDYLIKGAAQPAAELPEAEAEQSPNAQGDPAAGGEAQPTADETTAQTAAPAAPALNATAPEERTVSLAPQEDDGIITVGTLAGGAQAHKKKPRQRSKKKLTRRIIALVLAICVLAAAVGAVWHFGGVKGLWWALHGGKIQYPYVLVHGLGGRGNAGDGETAYWGGTAGDLVADLRDAGYAVVAPTVGPISSTWDRACELYAQLTGTTVDYGEAHAAQHGHSRYGRVYDTPLVPHWGDKINGGQRVKVNLVGHSFGGTTARLLTYLLANGNAQEQAATGSDTSPLFTGDKADWVHSVTTLAAPHDGTSLTSALNAPASLFGIDLSKTLFDALFKFAGLISTQDTAFDFMLDQFDIAAVSGSQAQKDVVTSFFSAGIDNAGYDLSPDGAKKLNNSIGIVDDVYYFSFAYCTTQEGVLLGEVPNAKTNPLLMVPATVIGSYTGTTPGGIEISDAWLPNDGLVNVISALYPDGEPHQAFEESGKPKDFERGVWYVSETLFGDHGTPIGLDGDADALHAFWTAQFERIDALKRS